MKYPFYAPLYCLEKLGFLVVVWLLSGLLPLRAQGVYPVQASVQLQPPYSVYLSDYAQPGEEKLRVILLQRDLTQVSYQLRLVLTVELNGQVLLRTSRSFTPAPISLDPGLPTVLSGSDLAPYLDSRNLDFVGYSREQYEKTRALPEGAYRICVSVYDYHRQDVAVAGEACAFYYLAKAEPPLMNYPSCGTKVPMRQPQQVIFSWLGRNTASPNSAGSTQYQFSLYEVRPAGRNPQDVVLVSAPIYQVVTDFTQLVYGPSEPPLLEGMQYVWRVQAQDREGRDAFRNNGYSEVCAFSYGGVDPGLVAGAVQDFRAQASSERKAQMSWRVEKGFETYRLEYRRVGQDQEWFRTETKEGSSNVFDLVADTEYETRVQGGVRGVYGPYCEPLRFRTPKARVVACGQTPPVVPLPGKPLAFATQGMIINARGMEVILEQVKHLSEDGYYRGSGRVSMAYLGGASFAVRFDRLYIDEERNVGAGRIEVLSRGVEAMASQQLAAQQDRQHDRQQEENRSQYQEVDFYPEVISYGEIVIDSVSISPAGEVTIKEEKGQTYQDAALNQTLLTASAAGQALVIQDKNGDQWVVKPDKTVEKVPGGGLPPLKNVSKESLDVVKKALKELRKEYDDKTMQQMHQELVSQQKELEALAAADNAAAGTKGTTGSSTTPLASQPLLYDFVEVAAEEATNGNFDQLSGRYKQQELAFNRAVVIRFFAEGMNRKDEYKLIAQDLKVNGQEARFFIEGQQKAAKPEDETVTEVKKAITQLIDEVILKASQGK